MVLCWMMSVVYIYIFGVILLKMVLINSRKGATTPRAVHLYTVVNCGISGHNIRSGPSLKSPPIGILILGNTVQALASVSY